jgi:site-specific DNA-methyltransferase (adenine-specific)
MYQAKIKITAIEPKDRFRQDFGNLEELKLSLKTNGLITPIAVQTKKDGSFLLLAGERRLRAGADLGWEEIEAKVWTEELSELDIRCIELAENLYRKDFTWQEKVRLEAHIHALQVGEHGEKVSPTGKGHSQADTARFLGVSAGGVSESIKMAKAFEAVPELAQSKTREDAFKMLRALQETAIHEELLKRATTQQATSTETSDELRWKMCSAFMIADAREGLRDVDAETIDFIEIDPPYAVGLDEHKQGPASEMEEYTEVSDESYYQFMGIILDETVRILKPGRWLILWHGHHHTQVLASMLKARGLSVAPIPAIWVKPTGQCNHPEYTMASCYEVFLYASKGNAILLKQGRPNAFHVSPVPPQRKIHPTEKPIELLEAILQTFTMSGQKALVPFLGSGATLMAAANLGVDAFGFDLSEKFKRGYEVRILSQAYGKYFNSTDGGK